MILTDTLEDWKNHPLDKVFVWVTMGKSPMIAFDSKDSEFIRAANWAIESIGKRENFHLFHQMNGISADGIGFNGWETWAGKNASDLAKVLPDIEKKIKEIMEGILN